MRVVLGAVFILTLFIVSTAAHASDDIAIGKRFSLRSEILGEDRPIVIVVPEGHENSDARYPVLDGKETPGRTGGILPGVIVGIVGATARATILLRLSRLTQRAVAAYIRKSASRWRR